MKNLKVSGLAIYLLCLAAVLAVYYGFVYTGLSRETNDLNEEHSINAQQIASYNSMIQNKASLQKSIDDLTGKAKNVQNVSGIPASQLGFDLNKGLTSAGATATSVTMSDETAAGGKKASSGRVMTQVNITLTLDCTESQLAALLNYYEKKSGAVYYVTSLSTNQQNQDGQAAPSGKFTATLNMTAYYYSSSSSAPAGTVS